MYLFIYLRRRPHSHVSGNNTFSGWFWNISGFTSYNRQPGTEIKSVPVYVLDSDMFLGLLTAFYLRFFFFIMWCQNSVFKLMILVYVSLWSHFICTESQLPLAEWMNKIISVIYFTTVLQSTTVLELLRQRLSFGYYMRVQWNPKCLIQSYIINVLNHTTSSLSCGPSSGELQDGSCSLLFRTHPNPKLSLKLYFFCS